MKITCQDHNLALKRVVIPSVLKSSVVWLQHVFVAYCVLIPDDCPTLFQNLSLPCTFADAAKRTLRMYTVEGVLRFNDIELN
jgi:hypothetical protein